ncbi:hypothetical protein [Paraburkholderia bryophila]|nr:hypothetical protein [Paraburkholderia bryophila]
MYPISTSHLKRHGEMKVPSTSIQTNEPNPAQAARSIGPAVRLPIAPAVFDTSASIGTCDDFYPNRSSPGESSPLMTNAPFGVPTHYAREPEGPLKAEAGHQAERGVHRDDKGAAYIRQGGETFPITYDKDNGTWRVHYPENPTKYRYPVRQDGNGVWHVHDKVGQPGGWRGAPPTGISWTQHATTQLQQQAQQLQFQRQDLMQQRQHLQDQLHQFPAPQHANRSPLELAVLQSMLNSQIANINAQLHAIEQQLQQTNQQLQQLQNEPQH